MRAPARVDVALRDAGESLVEIPAEVLAAFGLRPSQAVEIGDVFYLVPPHVRYFKSTYERTAVVVRLQRDRHGEPVVAWLFYTTTRGGVPAAHSLPLQPGDGGLKKDCQLDSRLFKEIPVEDLLADCDKLGRLDYDRRQDVEAMIAGSKLPARVKALGP